MRILLANHSSYPGAASDEELARVLDEQAAVGLDLITDGQLGWNDPISASLAPLAGVRLGPITSLPGVPGAFRQPIIEAKLRRYQPLCVAALRHAAARAARPLKVVLTGPHTLAHSAAIATTAYRGVDDLADDLSAIVAQEVGALAAEGAAAVQIDEPMILTHPRDMRRLRELLEPIYDAAGGRIQVIAATYGSDAAALWAQLNTLPSDVIAVDCAGRPGVRDAVADSGAGKLLALGIVDGLSPALENADELARGVERLLRRYVHSDVWLQPSCGLRQLSAEQARAKLALLAAVRKALT
jgi:5-methyltetrahydropteroyltriglutamate--homocysteine methyltransferase